MMHFIHMYRRHRNIWFRIGRDPVYGTRRNCARLVISAWRYDRTVPKI